MFDIFNVIGEILVLVFLYLTTNRYHRLVKLERLENTGISAEKYNAYDKRLRLECVLFIVVIGSATILNKFTNVLIVVFFMLILGLTLKALINKCFSIPE